MQLAATRFFGATISCRGVVLAASNSRKAKPCILGRTRSYEKEVSCREPSVFRSPKVEFCVWALSKAYLVAFIYAPGISGTIDNPTTDVHNIYKELVCFI